MALLTHREIEKFEPLIKPLEEEEPVLSSWRYHLDSDGRRQNLFFRKIKDDIKRLYYYKENILLPQKGQIVILMTSFSPSASGSLKPIIGNLIKSQIKPYLVTYSKTKYADDKNVDSVDMNQIMFSFFTHSYLKQIKQRAIDLAKIIEEKLSNEIEVNFYWIFEGIVAKEFANKIVGQAGFILADSDKESFRKGFFIGAKNVSSAILQHGFFDRMLFPIHSRFHFDWGPYFSKEALKYGHPLERSISLGCPRFDRIKKIKEEAKDLNYFQRYGIEKRPVVVALSGVHIYKEFPQSIESFFQSIISMLENNIAVIIKKHPAEVDKNIYKKFLGKKLLQKVHFAFSDEDFHQLLFNSDFVFTNASAGSIEAMLLGIPVLWQKGAEENPFADVPLLGGGVYVDSKTISSIVKEIGLDGIERKEILEKQEKFLSQAIVNRGKATSEITKFILNITD